MKGSAGTENVSACQHIAAAGRAAVRRVRANSRQQLSSSTSATMLKYPHTQSEATIACDAASTCGSSMTMRAAANHAPAWPMAARAKTTSSIVGKRSTSTSRGSGPHTSMSGLSASCSTLSSSCSIRLDEVRADKRTRLSLFSGEAERRDEGCEFKQDVALAGVASSIKTEVDPRQEPEARSLQRDMSASGPLDRGRIECRQLSTQR
eukprot:scaffold53827_cov28-Tisochrysis_lutea.AAC.2